MTALRLSPLVLALVALFLAAFASASPSVTNGKFALSSIDGTTRRTIPFDASTTIPTDVSLEKDDVIRLAFSLASSSSTDSEDADSDATPPKAALPHQVVVQITADGVAPGEMRPASWTDVVQVKSKTRKASWNLRADRLPAALLRSERLHLTLLIGSFEGPSSRLPLATLSLPATLLDTTASPSPRHQAMADKGFLPWPERRHTFGTSPADSMPAKTISAAAAGVVVGLPWLAAVGLATPLLPSLQRVPLKTSSLLFLVSLSSLELLALKFWLDMTLLAFLPWLIALSLPAVFLGRAALGEMRRQRIKA